MPQRVAHAGPLGRNRASGNSFPSIEELAIKRLTALAALALGAIRLLSAAPAAADEGRAAASPQAPKIEHSDPDAARRTAERARAEELRARTAEELARQRALLEKLDERRASSVLEVASAPPGLGERADPRSAPRAPVERELPVEMFDERRLTIEPGRWDNATSLRVIERTLDADRDGKPEQIRYVDPSSGQLLRKHEDRNYDGTIDTWCTYEQAVIATRVLDSNDDGQRDVWERYAAGRAIARDVDRDEDGVVDAFYRYEGDSLVEERYDADSDGRIDLIVRYENRHRVHSEEDRDRDGRMDVWTTFRTVGGQEQIVRIERDARGRGRADTFETFEIRDGDAVLSRREEDLNGDGRIDILSVYENGKLVRREILDPTQVPL